MARRADPHSRTHGVAQRTAIGRHVSSWQMTRRDASPWGPLFGYGGRDGSCRRDAKGARVPLGSAHRGTWSVCGRAILPTICHRHCWGSRCGAWLLSFVFVICCMPWVGCLGDRCIALGGWRPADSQLSSAASGSRAPKSIPLRRARAPMAGAVPSWAGCGSAGGSDEGVLRESRSRRGRGGRSKPETGGRSRRRRAGAVLQRKGCGAQERPRGGREGAQRSSSRRYAEEAPESVSA